MKRYKLVDVVLIPLQRGIRYEVRSPLHCARMNSWIRNHGTYVAADGVWRRVFGSVRAAERFLAQGRTVARRMRLSTLGYDACDFALQPARKRRTRRSV